MNALGRTTRHGRVHVIRRCAHCEGPVVLFASWEDDSLVGWCPACENATPAARPHARSTLERLAPEGVYLPGEEAVATAREAAERGPLPSASELDVASLDVLAELSVLRREPKPADSAGWRGFVVLGTVVVLFTSLYQTMQSLSLANDSTRWGAGAVAGLVAGFALIGVGLVLSRAGDAGSSRVPPARLVTPPDSSGRGRGDRS